MAITSDGTTLYVAAFGSQKIGIFDTRARSRRGLASTPSAADHIPLSGGRTGRRRARRGEQPPLRATRASTTASRSSTRRAKLETRAPDRAQPGARGDHATAGASSTTRTSRRRTARRRARAATCSATSTAWPGISAAGARRRRGARTTTRSCRSTRRPASRPASPRRSPAPSGGQRRLPPAQGPDDDADAARHGARRADALARRSLRRHVAATARRSCERRPDDALDETLRRSRSSTPRSSGLLGRRAQLTAGDMHGVHRTSSCRCSCRRTRSATSTTRSTRPSQDARGRDVLQRPDLGHAQELQRLPHAEPGARRFFGTGGLSTFEGETQHFKVAAPAQRLSEGRHVRHARAGADPGARRSERAAGARLRLPARRLDRQRDQLPERLGVRFPPTRNDPNSNSATRAPRAQNVANFVMAFAVGPRADRRPAGHADRRERRPTPDVTTRLALLIARARHRLRRRRPLAEQRVRPGREGPDRRRAARLVDVERADTFTPDVDGGRDAQTDASLRAAREHRRARSSPTPACRPARASGWASIAAASATPRSPTASATPLSVAT